MYVNVEIVTLFKSSMHSLPQDMHYNEHLQFNSGIQTYSLIRFAL